MYSIATLLHTCHRASRRGETRPVRYSGTGLELGGDEGADVDENNRLVALAFVPVFNTCLSVLTLIFLTRQLSQALG